MTFVRMKETIYRTFGNFIGLVTDVQRGSEALKKVPRGICSVLKWSPREVDQIPRGDHLRWGTKLDPSPSLTNHDLKFKTTLTIH